MLSLKSFIKANIWYQGYLYIIKNKLKLRIWNYIFIVLLTLPYKYIEKRAVLIKTGEKVDYQGRNLVNMSLMWWSNWMSPVIGWT